MERRKNNISADVVKKTYITKFKVFGFRIEMPKIGRSVRMLGRNVAFLPPL